MNRTRTIAISLFAIVLFAVTSCAIAPHPNEKIIIGIWKPARVEKIVDSSALQAAKSTVVNDTVRKGDRGGGGGGCRRAGTLCKQHAGRKQTAQGVGNQLGHRISLLGMWIIGWKAVVTIAQHCASHPDLG